MGCLAERNDLHGVMQLRAAIAKRSVDDNAGCSISVL